MGLIRYFLFVVICMCNAVPAFSQDAERTIDTLNIQVEELIAQGRYEKALEPALKSLDLVEATFGREHSQISISLNNLAVLYKALGRYDEAEPIYNRALAIREATLGSRHPDVGQSLNNLATFYMELGRFDDAESLYNRALAIYETTLEFEHADYAQCLSNLAVLRNQQGRFGEAESLYLRALAIYETDVGSDHPQVAQNLNNLAAFYEELGRYDEAEPLHLRALAFREAKFGPDHPDVAESLNNLAVLYFHQSRFDDATRFFNRVLGVYEKTFGAEHVASATALNNLAQVYANQGRYREAELLHFRALRIRETALGSGHVDVALSLHNLAEVYTAEDRYSEAEPFYVRALKIYESALGPDHPDVATTLGPLGRNYVEEERYEEAEPLLFRSHAIIEAALGADHPYTATSLSNLGRLYDLQNAYKKAENYYARALEIYENTLGPEHPNTGVALTDLAKIYLLQDRRGEALNSIRRAAQIYAGRAARSAFNRTLRPEEELSEHYQTFFWHVYISSFVSLEQEDAKDALMDEAFGAAQYALQTKIGEALSQMGARFSVGQGELSLLIREQSDKAAEWQSVFRSINEKRSAFDDQWGNIEQLKERLASVDGDLDQIESELLQKFPQYTELSRIRPLSLSETQANLLQGEALVFFLAAPLGTHIWVVTSDRASWRWANISEAELTVDVAKLRKGISHDGGAVRLDVAHKLYDKLLGPFENAIKGVEHVIIVPSGPLQSLPFAVLLTEPPDANIVPIKDLRQEPWLIRDFAISVLPSVSSLRAIRTYASATTAPSAFVGFGNPILDADWMKKTNLAALPETADELKAIAASLGAPGSPVFLDGKATETSVKAMSLEEYRVVAFATHGLVAGDSASDLEEPALVLSHPALPSDQDDGFLTASEVALLNLNADWVILSACNTAAGDKPGADPLSGLARAFFYAGSKALLASHWPVYSDAAVALITKAFEELGDDPDLSRAEAMRRAMIALMDDTSKVANAHPATWAPFIIVGEGG
jgi:CHAT domain-containing protein/Tfp pilus assembly protein PilF